MPTEVVRLKIKTPWETEVLVIDLKFDKHSKVLQVNNLSASQMFHIYQPSGLLILELYNHMVPIMLTGLSVVTGILRINFV
jgi:hypothetical protein